MQSNKQLFYRVVVPLVVIIVILIGVSVALAINITRTNSLCKQVLVDIRERKELVSTQQSFSFGQPFAPSLLGTIKGLTLAPDGLLLCPHGKPIQIGVVGVGPFRHDDDNGRFDVEPEELIRQITEAKQAVAEIHHLTPGDPVTVAQLAEVGLVVPAVFFTGRVTYPKGRTEINAVDSPPVYHPE